MTFIENEYTELKSMVVSDISKEIIAFAGSDKSTFQDRREFSGSLFEQMEELW